MSFRTLRGLNAGLQGTQAGEFDLVKILLDNPCGICIESALKRGHVRVGKKTYDTRGASHLSSPLASAFGLLGGVHLHAVLSEGTRYEAVEHIHHRDSIAVRR